MPVPINHRTNALRQITLTAAALVLVACGQPSEEPTSPALNAETVEKPAQPIPAQLPRDEPAQTPIEPEVKTELAQVLPPPLPSESKAQPNHPAAVPVDESTAKTIDPHRLDELELKLNAQQEALERMQASLDQQQDSFNALQQKLNDFTANAQATSRPTAGRKRLRSAAHLQRRRGVQTQPSLPFSVESVDQWGEEKRIVIRAHNHRFDLKPGEAYGGWTVESAEGQQVTLIDRDGHRQVLDATWK